MYQVALYIPCVMTKSWRLLPARRATGKYLKSIDISVKKYIFVNIVQYSIVVQISLWKLSLRKESEPRFISK